MARAVGKLTGFREASKQLNEMKKAAAQGVGRRALQVPANILAEKMRATVNVLSGATRESINVTREKAQRGRPQVGVTVEDIASVQLEFGNNNMPAEPFARPALQEAKGEMLAGFADALVSETDKTVRRAAAKAAKAKG